MENNLAEWLIAGSGAGVTLAVIKLLEELIKYRAAVKERREQAATEQAQRQHQTAVHQTTREDDLTDRYTALLSAQRNQMEAEMREWRDAYQAQVDKRFGDMQAELDDARDAIRRANKAADDARNQAAKYQEMYITVAKTNIAATQQVTVLQNQITDLRERIQQMSEEFAVEREGMEVVINQMRERLTAAEDRNRKLQNELRKYTDTGPLRPSQDKGI